MGQCQVRRVAMRRLNAARRCSDDHTTSHPPRHRRRQRRRQKHHLARTYEYPRRRDGHPRLHRRLSQVRPQRAAQRCLTPLRPECNYIDVMEQHLECLHYGQPILKPVYEHDTGTLVRPEYVRPRPFVLVDGLLGFSTPTLRQFYDVKVFLEPPEDLRKVWKLKRDTTRRGYTTQQVLAELERREPDSRELHSPAARVCRRRGDVLSAGGLFAGGGGAKPERAVGAAAHDSSPGPQLPGSHRPCAGQRPRQPGIRRAAAPRPRPGTPGGRPGNRRRRGRPARGRVGRRDVAALARPAAGEQRSIRGLPGWSPSAAQFAAGADAAFDRLPPAAEVQRPFPTAVRAPVAALSRLGAVPRVAERIGPQWPPRSLNTDRLTTATAWLRAWLPGPSACFPVPGPAPPTP